VRVPYAPTAWLCGPAGSIYSTLDDMTRWLQVNLGGGSVDGTRVLSVDTVRQLHTSQMVMPEASLFPETRDVAYGLGWFIGTYRGHKLVHHGGNIDGFTSLVTMLPEDGIGVVFLSNKDVTPLRAAFSFHVFDELLGLEQIAWEDRLEAFMDATQGGAREAKARAVRIADKPPSRPLAEFAGDYEHPAYGRLTISVGEAGLVPSFRQTPLALQHRHFDTFDLKIDQAMERYENLQLPLTFRADPEGEIADLVLPIEPSVAPIVFTRLPDAELSDERFLRALEGAYAMGPVTLEIRLSRPGRLVASISGQAPVQLEPWRDRTFRIEGAQGASATFELDDAGTVREILVQPVGVFIPVPTEAS
jgi:hypothetical protein